MTNAPPQWTEEELAEDSSIAGVLAHLDVTEAVLVGHSM